MTGQRRLHEVRRSLHGESDKTVETTAEDALASRGTPTRDIKDAVEETSRLAALTANGQVDETDLAALGVTGGNGVDLSRDRYDDQVLSYPENTPEVGENHTVPVAIEDGRASYLD